MTGVCRPQICKGFKWIPYLLNSVTVVPGGPYIYRWLWWNWWYKK